MIRARLLASAFAPASLIGGIRLIPDATIAAAMLVAFAFLAVLSLVGLVSGRPKIEPQPYTTVDVVDESAEVPAFLLTYLFPFVSLSISTWWDVAAYAVFVVLLLAILFRTDLLLVNPLLLLAGIRVYRVLDSSGVSRIVFSKTRLHSTDQILAASLASGALRFVRFPIGGYNESRF